MFFIGKIKLFHFFKKTGFFIKSKDIYIFKITNDGFFIFSVVWGVFAISQERSNGDPFFLFRKFQIIFHLHNLRAKLHKKIENQRI